MSLLLSIETSTPVCSVALHDDGKLVGSSTLYLDRSHAEKLGRLTGGLISVTGYTMGDLSGIALSGGPGSYTGLRIGCSFAKGLCQALGVPLITVGTLQALTRQVVERYPGTDYFCPMIDARRMEVYAQVNDRRLNMLLPVQPIILTEDITMLNEFAGRGEILFFGNGSAKARAVIRHANARFIPDIVTEASAVGQLAWEKYCVGEFADLAYYEPFYLKEFRATVPKKLL